MVFSKFYIITYAKFKVFRQNATIQIHTGCTKEFCFKKLEVILINMVFSKKSKFYYVNFQVFRQNAPNGNSMGLQTKFI